MYIKRLRDLREDHDLLQKEVADYLHITQQQYSLYECGRREIPLQYILMLAKKYNVSTDYILGNSNVKNFDELVGSK